MMDVCGKYFIVEKHRKFKRKSKPVLARRRFYDAGELDEARQRAGLYAGQKKEDFLLVQVIDEISKPGETTGANDDPKILH